MLAVRLDGDAIHVGARFSVAFQRTLRIPDDGRTYPLPPGLGRLPVHRADDYANRVPDHWRAADAFFVPMSAREALWLAFSAAEWKPNAVKVGAGGINAITGERWRNGLHVSPQDYIVCPEQPWLDGINAGGGEIRQFVAMPLGAGYTIEGQLTGVEEVGGVRIAVFEPKPGRFPDAPPPRRQTRGEAVQSSPAGGTMGLAAGGRMTQKIYPDPYGLDTWDQNTASMVDVYMVNGEQYRAITGCTPPPVPIDANTYTRYGLPWFALYDEAKGTLDGTEPLSRVKSTGGLDRERGLDTSGGDQSIDVPIGQVTKVAGRDPDEPR